MHFIHEEIFYEEVFHEEIVQCLLLVIHDEKVPVEEGSSKSLSPREVDPSKIKGLALLPHNINVEGIIGETFLMNNVQVIQNKEECPSLLTEAITDGRMELLEIYLVDPFENVPQRYPLKIYVRYWDINIVGALFSRDVDIECEEDLYFSAKYFSALDEANLAVFEHLLSFGSDFRLRHEFEGNLLYFAARKGSEPFVKLLVRSGVDIDAKTPDGKTPLFMAVVGKHTSIINYLLQQGADVNAMMRNAVDYEGITPLHMALRRKVKPEIVRLLLEKGANVNADSKQGCILYFAIKSNPELLSCVLQYHPDLHSRANWLAFREALNQNNKETIGLLVNYGFSTARDDLDAFFQAIFSKNIEIVKQVLKEGVDVNYCCFNNLSDFYGMRPLHVAVENFQEEILQLLLDHGADVTSKSTQGTPLFHAVKVFDSKAVQFLFANGARISDDPSILDTIIEVKPPTLKVDEINNNFYFSRLEYYISGVTDCKNSALAPIISALLEHGYSLRRDNERFRRYLMGHAHFGNWEVVEILFKHKVFEKSDLLEAMVRAIRGRSLETVEFFLKYIGNPVADKFFNHSLLDVAHEEVLPVVPSLEPLDQNVEIIDIFAQLLNFNYLNLKLIADSGIFEYYVEPDETIAAFKRAASKKRREFITKHILKLKAANLLINEKYSINNFPDLVQDIDRFQNICELEVERLRNKKIGVSTISFYDFLNANPAQISRLIRNDCIVDVLKLDDYKNEFPIYSGIINCQFQKAYYRESLVKRGILMFNFLFEKSFMLPFGIKECILGYLNNQNLLVLSNVL